MITDKTNETETDSNKKKQFLDLKVRFMFMCLAKQTNEKKELKTVIKIIVYN